MSQQDSIHAGTQSGHGLKPRPTSIDSSYRTICGTFKGHRHDRNKRNTLLALMSGDATDRRGASPSLSHHTARPHPNDARGEQSWRSLGAWSVPSEPGNERLVMARVAAAVKELHLPPDRLHGLTTAVAEATMNAIEHGNQNRPDLPVAIQVLACATAVRVRITDQGGGRAVPPAATPDLRAKLAGRQTPRGWGLFLIKSLVDDVQISGAGGQRTTDLLLYRDRERHDGDTENGAPPAGQEG